MTVSDSSIDTILHKVSNWKIEQSRYDSSYDNNKVKTSRLWLHVSSSYYTGSDTLTINNHSVRLGQTEVSDERTGDMDRDKDTVHWIHFTWFQLLVTVLHNTSFSLNKKRVRTFRQRGRCTRRRYSNEICIRYL